MNHCCDFKPALSGARLTLHSVLVGGDGRTLHSHVELLCCQSGVNGDLVISLVSVGQTQVKVLQLHIHVGQDELQKDQRVVFRITTITEQVSLIFIYFYFVHFNNVL